MDYSERRKEKGRRTEQDILQAAMELSRAASFDKVTIRDICHKAGITTGAFYHHFTSKEELLTKGFAPLDRRMEEALEGREKDPPQVRLHLILTTYAGFMEEQGPELVARYYQRRISNPSAASMDSTRYTLRAMLDCLRAEEREKGGLAGGRTPEWMAEFFFRHFRGTVVDWTIHRGAYSLQEKTEEDYRLFVGMLGA